MTHSHPSRLSLATAVLAVAVGGIAIGGTATAAPGHRDRPAAAQSAAGKPAAKQKLTNFNLDTTAVKIVTTSHSKLLLGINADQYVGQLFGPVSHSAASNSATSHSAASHRTKEAEVDFSTRNGAERHDWTFKLAAAQLRANPKAGKGSLTTKSRLGAFGKLDLTVTPEGKAAVQKPCPSMTVTSRPVVMSGSVSYDTGTGKHGWGTFSTKHFATKGVLTGTYGSYKSGCATPTPKQRCVNGLFASDYTYAATPADTTTALSASQLDDKAATVNVERDVPLAKPKHAVRDDSVTRPIEPLTIQDVGTTHVVTVTGTGSSVQGSGVWSDPNDPSIFAESSCKNPTSEAYYAAMFSNGTTPLRFATSVFGAITIDTSNGSSAVFYRDDPTLG